VECGNDTVLFIGVGSVWLQVDVPALRGIHLLKLVVVVQILDYKYRIVRGGADKLLSLRLKAQQSAGALIEFQVMI
jgi:hypothetical protein